MGSLHRNNAHYRSPAKNPSDDLRVNGLSTCASATQIGVVDVHAENRALRFGWVNFWRAVSCSEHLPGTRRKPILSETKQKVLDNDSASFLKFARISVIV